MNRVFDATDDLNTDSRLNKRDLLAQVSAATFGWVSTATDPSGSARVARLHQALLDLVKRSGDSPRQMAALKRALIAEINEACRALVSASSTLVSDLSDAQLVFDLRDADGGWKRTSTSAADVPSMRNARRVFSLSSMVHSLEPMEQAQVMQAYDLEAELCMKSLDVQGAVAEADPIGLAEAQRELCDHRAAIEKWIWEAPKAARDFVDDNRNFVTPEAWTGWAIPVLLSSAASNAELIEGSQWFERVRASMYRPLPIDETASTAKVRMWKRLWRDYDACATGFELLAVWLKAIAASEGRRCQICYRHLAEGAGMRRFCDVHKRRSHKRQNTRDLHISRLYLPVAKRKARFKIELRERLEAWQITDREARVMRHQAVVAGVHHELIAPASTLAASLRVMFPVLSPPVREHVQKVFLCILEVASEPFRRQVESNMGERVSESLKKEAIQLLRWEHFFKALFGPTVLVPWAEHAEIGAGLDIEHPMARGHALPPRRLAVDLTYLGAWMLVDGFFDRFAYLDARYLSRLRRGDPAAGLQAMSLAQIARSAGASVEAVRQTLRHADALGASGDRRYRIIPSGIRLLQSQLKTTSW